MKAIAYSQHGLPIGDEQSLIDVEIDQPVPGPRDLLIEVRAVSVNPVDTKVRQNSETVAPRILGWDAAGVVQATGEAVTLFQPGDEVFYAGSITRPGSNSEFHLVDERIAGHKPSSLDFAQSAALPLTSITAWELLFDRLKISERQGKGETLLVVGAAGGVGSMLIQLARQLTSMTVIGTASRPETLDWVKALGAHHVINHYAPLKEQLLDVGITEVHHVASLTHTASYFEQLIAVLAPQGQLALIDDPESLNVLPMKGKSLSLHWEFMFTRPIFQTSDMIQQHQLLERISELVDQGHIKTTLGAHFGTINAANLRRAHALIESNQAKGKVVLEGF